MIEIIPAILTNSAKTFREQIAMVSDFAPYIQIDILDNEFAEGRTLLPLALKREKIKLAWEAHLMVMKPKKYLKDLAFMGCRRVIFHERTVPDSFEFIQEIRRLKMEAGVAVNPADPIVRLAGYSQIANTFMVMGVIPGKQGQQFNKHALTTIAVLKDRYIGTTIAVDGGIRKTNIENIVHAGATRLAVGSAILKAKDPKKIYEELFNLANNV